MAQNGSYFGKDNILALDVAADGGAARAQFLYRVLELFGRQVGKLQGDRGERNVAVRMSGAPFRELFVVQPDDFGRQVTVRCGIEPVSVYAQDLHVDSQFVDGADAVRSHEVRSARARAGARGQGRVLHDVPNFGNDAMSVHVNDFHAPARYRYLPALYGSRRRARSALKGGLRERVSRQLASIPVVAPATVFKKSLRDPRMLRSVPFSPG